MNVNNSSEGDQQVGGMISASETQAELRLVALKEQLAEIEQIKSFAAQAKVDISAMLLSIKEHAATSAQQLDIGRSSVVELTTLSASIRTANEQNKDTSALVLASLESARAVADTAAARVSQIDALYTKVEQTAQIANTRSEHIEAGRLHTDDVRAKIDQQYQLAQQAASNSESQLRDSRTSLESVNAIQSALLGIKTNVEGESNLVVKFREQCELHTISLRKLAETADAKDQKVKEYESRISELESTISDRLKTINSLLPGATSAGLATAFNRRRSHFKRPQFFWQIIFVASVLSLLAIAGLEFSIFSSTDKALTWDRLVFSFMHRLPFAAPLIWLAIHASHKAALAQRVEEDYAFKETVSSSFEGFRREMTELAGKATPDSVISVLCMNVLGIITNPPGRIYDKHPLNKSVLDAFKEAKGISGDGAAKDK